MANRNPQDPAREYLSITASDTGNILFRGLYVGASGDVKINDEAGTTITFTALAAGVIHPIGGTRVYATGTTATGIVGVL